ncbi:MAG: hypothetical protein LCH85_22225 [Chloroflexi bacterium]|nr:hypothetical protein [Chloroflexota bacterium]
MRLYFQGNPLGLWHTPQWLLELLIEELSATEAREKLNQINIVSMPHSKAAIQRRMIRRLKKLADPPTKATSRWPASEHNPAAAAEWFQQQGIEVAHAG